VNVTARIGAVFERARAQRRCAIIPYVVAGDPDLQTTALVLRALAEGGADLIELGVPYGDPLADGPTIASAAQRALAHGTALSDVFGLVRAADGRVPIVLFSYFNPIVQYGVERFAADLAQAGSPGAIVPDVPLEELELLRPSFAAHSLELPLLIAPTTPPERARLLTQESGGFIYLVARLGVTGAARAPNFEAILTHLRELRAMTSKPIAVGFGISSPEHVRGIAQDADGVIVGSALIDAIAGLRGNDAAACAGDFVRELVEAARHS
jgi:tryptophan synthase alpha chain